MYASIVSKLVSETINKSLAVTPNLSPRILICSSDSSPDTYKTFPYLDAILLAVCNSNVDFPIPGSPKIKFKDPFTNLLQVLYQVLLDLF